MINPIDGKEILTDPIPREDIPRLMYHFTHPRNVGSIKRWGIIPRYPIEHNYKMHGELKDQPKGVYVVKDKDRWNGTYVCVIDTTQVDAPIVEDPEIMRAGVILGRVPPRAIVAVKRR